MDAGRQGASAGVLLLLFFLQLRVVMDDRVLKNTLEIVHHWLTRVLRHIATNEYHWLVILIFYLYRLLPTHPKLMKSERPGNFQ
jgi:hypothetical protein